MTPDDFAFQCFACDAKVRGADERPWQCALLAMTGFKHELCHKCEYDLAAGQMSKVRVVKLIANCWKANQPEPKA